MVTFYSEAIDRNQIVLSNEESHHCVRVLRKHIGDQVEVIDGLGNRFTCELADEHKKHCRLTVISSTGEADLGYRLEIATALPKNIARFEWFLEKATEIGISRINPVICDNSERTKMNFDRSKKILISAMKQSKRSHLPELSEPIKISKWIEQTDHTDQQLIATCVGGDLPHLKSAYQLGKNTTILIGPEGDFSEKELKLALDLGWQGISLGAARLRMETAALVSVNTISILNQ